MLVRQSARAAARHCRTRLVRPIDPASAACRTPQARCCGATGSFISGSTAMSPSRNRGYSAPSTTAHSGATEVSSAIARLYRCPYNDRVRLMRFAATLNRAIEDGLVGVALVDRDGKVV